MQLFMKHITRLIVLPFFLMYAVSPLYLSAVNDDAAISDLHAADQHVNIGMVWLSFVIDSVAPEQARMDAKTVDQTVHAEQNDEMILVKKKRVIARQNYILDPIFEVSTAEPVRTENPVFMASMFDIPCDLIHSNSDGYHSLSTGLSPPSFLS